MLFNETRQHNIQFFDENIFSNYRKRKIKDTEIFSFLINYLYIYLTMHYTF